MLIISHRGNLSGPFPEKENSPDYVGNSISQGFQTEIDFWEANGKLYLGHDAPKYLINQEWLDILKPFLWIHCKNLSGLDYITQQKGFRYFWHENDTYTLTSDLIIWTYPRKKISQNCILVSLNKQDDLLYKRELDNNQLKLKGICTDYPYLYV
jgi:hypothetical protein